VTNTNAACPEICDIFAGFVDIIFDAVILTIAEASMEVQRHKKGLAAAVWVHNSVCYMHG
jgi:hypothetical protein